MPLLAFLESVRAWKPQRLVTSCTQAQLQPWLGWAAEHWVDHAGRAGGRQASGLTSALCRPATASELCFLAYQECDGRCLPRSRLRIKGATSKHLDRRLPRMDAINYPLGWPPDSAVFKAPGQARAALPCAHGCFHLCGHPIKSEVIWTLQTGH